MKWKPSIYLTNTLQHLQTKQYAIDETKQNTSYEQISLDQAQEITSEMEPAYYKDTRKAIKEALIRPMTQQAPDAYTQRRYLIQEESLANLPPRMITILPSLKRKKPSWDS